MDILLQAAPWWFYALAALCLVTSVLLLPTSAAQRAASIVIEGPQAKLVAAIAAMFGFAVVIATAIQIQIDLRDRLDERAQRHAESIARSWEALIRPVPGSTGKAAALKHLISVGESINGLDLSCAAIGRLNNTTASCEKSAIFEGLDIDGAELNNTDSGMSYFGGINFSGNSIVRAKLNALHFEQVALNKTQLASSVITYSVLNGDAREAKITDSNLTGTVVAGSSEGLSLENVIVTNAVFSEPEAVFRDNAKYVWAWADAPPRAIGRGALNGIRKEKVTPQAPELMRPIPRDLLGTVRLCRPPMREGKPIPLNLRGTPKWSCKRMTADEAISEFPEIFRWGRDRG
ncbi:hypothetical protein [Synechococcus phage Ssp-JY39]|nr:HetL [Synechococcus phage Yong-M2-251]